MMKHVMIDLETMDTKPSTVILSIGAVKFDPLTGLLGEKYYETVSSDNQFLFHRTVSESTMKWWEEQDEEVRKEAFSGQKSLSGVLHEFATWLGDGCKVWGNGATFDISILEHAYDYNAPWKFWDVRDVRTVVELTNDFIEKGELPEGEAHNALNDAIHQAKFVSVMYKRIREGLVK